MNARMFNPPTLTAAQTVATIIDSYAIDMRITAEKAQADGATDEVMAYYMGLVDKFQAAADWLRKEDTHECP